MKSHDGDVARGPALEPGAGWSGRDLVFDLAGFGLTVLFVLLFRWQARDVIWGLWTCSLCVGYAYIVTAILATVARARGVARAGALMQGVFLLAFFTVHFGMFHYGHAVFLNLFFPLVDLDQGFPDLLPILKAALAEFWPLVLATLLSRFRDFPVSGLAGDGKRQLHRPYANVVRMHLLIFVFAGLHVADLGRLALLPVLAAYFFPWGRLFRSLRDREQRVHPAPDAPAA